MTIREFVDLFYIKEYLKNQDRAFMNLVKGSVESYDLLTYADDSYHGILAGNNPHMFAKQVIDAGLTVEKISHHIETLYPIKHTGSVKAKEQYQNKAYKDALYEKVQDKFDGITLEKMSGVLAQMFCDIIQDAAKESENASKPRNASRIVLSYTILDDEKKAILNLCGLICGSLQCIKQKIETIDRKQHELRGPSEDKTNER